MDITWSWGPGPGWVLPLWALLLVLRRTTSSTDSALCPILWVCESRAVGVPRDAGAGERARGLVVAGAVAGAGDWDLWAAWPGAGDLAR